MKLLITADCHVPMLSQPQAELDQFMTRVLAEQADAFYVCGDLGEGSHGYDPNYALLLGTHPRTFFVLGNHDLFRHRRAKLPPPEAMAVNLKHFAAGLPLEKSWDDAETVHVCGDMVFVGSIGFPDFGHPLVRAEAGKYNANCATIDSDYIDLELGWLVYTRRLHTAFEARLAKAFQAACRNVIVLTHYPILEQQAVLSASDREMWPYFFNWHMGQLVLRFAREHPSKRVWCFAGHSHEFCRGTLTQAAPNVFAYGHRTSYGQSCYCWVDTDAAVPEARFP